MIIVSPRVKKAIEDGLLPVFKRSTGQSQDTLDSWTGGTSYKQLFSLHLFGYKVEFWKKL